ncbi:hypothetical protein [Rosettibacter firmus]
MSSIKDVVVANSAGIFFTAFCAGYAIARLIKNIAPMHNRSY